MAYISFQPKDYFNTKLYTGTGSSNSITGVGFQPDWVWIKRRSATSSHQLFDAVRGVTKRLFSDSNEAESTSATTLTSFDTDGFTVSTHTGLNNSSDTYASWNWKAGTTSGISTNGSTTITPDGYSFNQTSGFSVIEYTGNGVAGAKLPHGLGAEPHLVIAKTTNLVGEPWQVYSKSLGNTNRLFLNLTNASTSATEWNSTTPDSVNVTLGNGTHINSSGNNFIAYCFTPVKGYSAMGSYTGNGSADGAFVYTGFRPAWVMVKKSSASGDNWSILDNKRNTFNVMDKYLDPNSNNAEGTADIWDFTSSGFKMRNTFSGYNASGATYIYMAFAEHPLVSSNDIPATAR
jgi:hypothetical protein